MSEMTKFNLRTFFLDIEVYSPDCFPEADQANYPINIISLYDTETMMFYSWGLKDYYYNLEDIEIPESNIRYVSCSSEKDLLSSFIKFWKKNYPDIVSGWNSASFDIPYLINRINNVFGEDKAKQLSPTNSIFSRTRKNYFDKFYTHWTIDGVSDIDYMELYAKSIIGQQESYKLDYIGKVEEVGSKVEYESSNLANLADTDWDTFVKYNIQDVNLMVNLEKKKRYLVIARGKAYRGYSTLDKCLDSVPIVTGMIAKSALDENKIIVTFKPKKVDEEFEGGFVFSPSGKMHSGIVSFDVNSLYPNTMITLNTSPETKLGKVKELSNGDKEILLVNGKHRKMSEVEYKDFISKNEIIVSKSNILFSQKKRGICAKFLDDLYQERKKIKAQMVKEKDPIRLDQMDIEQYLVKILLNSVYGVFGNPYFCLYDVDIASSVTLTGQSMIKMATEMVKEFAKTEYHIDDLDHFIVYGDSVTGDTPILLQNEYGQIEIKQIDDIDDSWISYDSFKSDGETRIEKEQTYTKYKVWTSSGWSTIKRIIRHKVEKDIYRVKTHIGFVDVTEDHSLLSATRDVLKPKDCKVGTELLHSYPTFNFNSPKPHKEIYNLCNSIREKSIKEKEAFIYGFFYGDGSCGAYKYSYGNKYSWALNNSNPEYNKLLVDLLKDIYNEEFKILDTLESSGVYKTVPVGDIVSYVSLYRSKFYNKDKFKIVPIEILNAEPNIKESFLAGYFLSDGYKCDNVKCKNLSFNNKGKIGLSGLLYLFKSLGYNVSLNDRKDKFNNYRLLATTKKLRKPEIEIKDIYKLTKSSLSEYVYDIETETGDFNTGTPLIVKNTDSCFFDFGKITDAVGIKFFENNKVTKEAIELIDKFTENLNTKINIWAKTELNSKDPRYLFSREKICLKGIFLTKKNYILRVVNNENKDCDKLVEAGVELRKSTHSEPVKNLMRSIIECIFYDKGKVEADSKYIDAIDKFKEFPVEDIAKRGNVKTLDKFINRVNYLKILPNTPQHYKGTIYYNHLIDSMNLGSKYPKITSGQKVKLVYLQPNKYGFDCIAFLDKFPVEFGLFPDCEKQFSKMVTSLIQRCYIGNNWKLPNIDKSMTTDLFSFMDEL